MSNNAPDYNDNLVFPPEGDWADTNPRANTDRTASTIELVIKIEELNKWLDLKSEYIEKLETENNKLKEQLDVKEAMIKNYTAEIETQRQQLKIAIATLELYALEKMRLKAKDGTEYELANTGYCRAKETLKKIKELGK